MLGRRKVLCQVDTVITCFLDRALDNFVLEHKWNGNEDEIQKEHGEAETLVHSPFEASDAHDHEE